LTGRLGTSGHAIGGAEWNQNNSPGPVYFQVMLGRGKPDTLGYADDEVYKRRDAHLKAV
jgi:hypothetical protein